MILSIAPHFGQTAPAIKRLGLGVFIGNYVLNALFALATPERQHITDQF